MYMEYSDDGILSSNEGSKHIFHAKRKCMLK